MGMINTVVVGLDNLDGIVPTVQNLGKRHVAYGATDSHYDTVGAAKGLGDEFTDEVEAAWVSAYTLLADTMKVAAND